MIKIANVSGNGGTGKTLISTNLFYALQRHDSCVTLDIKIINKLLLNPQVVVAMVNCMSIIEWALTKDFASK